MKYSVNITGIAEEDILSTVKYIGNILKNPIAANNLLDEIERYEKILEDTPNIYPFVQDELLTQKGLRYFSVKNFLMFYMVMVNEGKRDVNIIRFLHGRRDWKNILLENEKE